MSILRKIPKIEQVLDNMSIESLKRLESLMNSGNGATETYTLFGGENKLNYVNKDLGVWYCNIELERNKSVETGFLIWESQTKALFVSYDITQCLKEYEIDLTNYTYTKINEKLSIEEFRRVLEDNINKEVVHIDTSGNVEVGKNLVVGGKVILNGKQDLVDTSGNVLISGSSGGGDADVVLELNNEDSRTVFNHYSDGITTSSKITLIGSYEVKKYNKVKLTITEGGMTMVMYLGASNLECVEYEGTLMNVDFECIKQYGESFNPSPSLQYKIAGFSLGEKTTFELHLVNLEVRQSI